MVYVVILGVSVIVAMVVVVATWLLSRKRRSFGARLIAPGVPVFVIVAISLGALLFLALRLGGAGAPPPDDLPGSVGPPPPPPAHTGVNGGLRPSDRTNADESVAVWRTSLRNPADHQSVTLAKRRQSLELRVRFAWRPAHCENEVERIAGTRVQEIAESGVTLGLTMVADPEFLEVADADQTRQILLSRDVPDDSCNEAADDSDPQVRKTVATFRLKTKNRTGAGRVAVVIYRGGRPIDEIPLKICVECQGQPALDEANELSDAAHDMMNAADEAPLTDASLYIFDFANGASAGTLALRTGDEEFKYYPWANSGQSVQSIRQSLTDDFARSLSTATTDERLASKANELANLLFPPDSADTARDSLEKFLLDAHKAKRPPPSLLVRISSINDRSPIVFPIGLVAMRSVKDGSGYLGRYARIVMPLNVQNYTEFDECPGQVMAVLPARNDANSALKGARMAMGATVADRWERAATGYEWSSTGKFGEWAAGRPRVDKAAVLFMLTHHFEDSIWINENEPVGSNAVKGVKFLQPSWAVLNGCGTGASRVSGDGFARLLNAAGMQAVIATHSEVPASLAGAYFACMDQALASTPANPAYRLGSAHFAATECLWNKEQTPAGDGVPAVRWGANALKYTLLGNPNLKVCRIK